jgi:hypothetical protein
MESCLRNDEGAAHLTSEAHHDASPSSHRAETSNHSPLVLHCAPLADLVRPAALAASAQISGTTKNVLLDSSSFSLGDEFHGKGNVRLTAHFKRIIPCSYPSDLPYRLFLSILQI